MIVHPLSIVDPKAVLAADVKVYEFTSILAGTVIGEGSVIGGRCFIGKNCKIGAGVHIQDGCFLPHGTVIEDNAFLGPSVTLTDDKYPVAGNRRYKAQPPVVRELASIGAGAVILPGVEVGKGAVIGAGAVVTRDAEAGLTVIGMPARIA